MAKNKCKQEEAPCGQGKVWYKSKRVMLALITLFASYAQYKWGMVIDGPTQGIILGVAMLIIGILTNSPLTWNKGVKELTEEQEEEPEEEPEEK